MGKVWTGQYKNWISNMEKQASTLLDFNIIVKDTLILLYTNSIQTKRQKKDGQLLFHYCVSLSHVNKEVL